METSILDEDDDGGFVDYGPSDAQLGIGTSQVPNFQITDGYVANPSARNDLQRALSERHQHDGRQPANEQRQQF